MKKNKRSAKARPVKHDRARFPRRLLEMILWTVATKRTK